MSSGETCHQLENVFLYSGEVCDMQEVCNSYISDHMAILIDCRNGFTSSIAIPVLTVPQVIHSSKSATPCCNLVMV